MSKDQTEKFRPTSDDSALEDTEAHGARFNGVRPADEDTEGHMPLRRATQPLDEDDDTEGHGLRRG
jgi:hypothetical protein